MKQLTNEKIDDMVKWLDELGSFATRRQALMDSLNAGRVPDERWDTFIAEARQAGFDGMADDMERRATHYREVWA